MPQTQQNIQLAIANAHIIRTHPSFVKRFFQIYEKVSADLAYRYRLQQADFPNCKNRLTDGAECDIM